MNYAFTIEDVASSFMDNVESKALGDAAIRTVYAAGDKAFVCELAQTLHDAAEAQDGKAVSARRRDLLSALRMSLRRAAKAAKADKFWTPNQNESKTEYVIVEKTPASPDEAKRIESARKLLESAGYVVRKAEDAE